MIARLLIAVAGAIIVTASLLLGMDAVTSVFRNETGERYFRITDILPKPPPGRPQRPEPGALPPDRVDAPEIRNTDAALPVQAPSPAGLDSPALQGPEIEPATRSNER